MKNTCDSYIKLGDANHSNGRRQRHHSGACGVEVRIQSMLFPAVSSQILTWLILDYPVVVPFTHFLAFASINIRRFYILTICAKIT